MIVKAVDGSGGNRTWEITSDEELKIGPLRYYAPYHLLIQPKIVAQVEFRVIVLGNSLVGGVAKSPASGDFRANWRQGGELVNTVLPPIVEEISLRSSQAVKCEFAGIDILYTKNGSDEECWVLEVNRYFGFNGFEQTTHINVASLLVRWIQDRPQCPLPGEISSVAGKQQ